MKPDLTTGRAPDFRVEEYFAGRTQAWGIFQDRFGKLRRQFVVDIEGEWDGESLTLVENFIYDDGKTERRTWTIRKTGEHSYEGIADGVIGVAEGKCHGNALNWHYRFALQVGGSTWNVTFNDWMFLQTDGVMINRAAVSKFGIELGELTIAFRKNSAAAAEAPARLRKAMH